MPLERVNLDYLGNKSLESKVACCSEYKWMITTEQGSIMYDDVYCTMNSTGKVIQAGNWSIDF